MTSRCDAMWAISFMTSIDVLRCDFYVFLGPLEEWRPAVEGSELVGVDPRISGYPRLL